MKQLPEINRLIYGCVGIIVGIAINRVAGLHIVMAHIAADGLAKTNLGWFTLFCVGLAIGFGTPGWFWLVRPTIASSVETVDPRYPTDD